MHARPCRVTHQRFAVALSSCPASWNASRESAAASAESHDRGRASARARIVTASVAVSRVSDLWGVLA
eukprot:363609-Chlamydomonas_euryale.AAC.19